MTRRESKSRQYFVTLLIGIVIIGVILVQTAAIYWLLNSAGLSTGITALIILPAIILIIVFLFVLVDRCKEIRQEESDETRQY